MKKVNVCKVMNEVEKCEILNKMMVAIEEEITRTIKELAERYNLNVEEASNYIMNRKEEKVRGRPKKVSEEKVSENKKEKGARGRPRKEEKPERSYVGEDLIARLIEEARKKEGM